MSATIYSVHEHTVPCSFIRGYARTTADGTDDQLQLAVKQYVPLDNTHPQPGDVTLIGAHANGFPKELYEPLWDELYHTLKRANVRIRGIWIADVAWQGYSSVLNEHKLGNDPYWLDHSTDLLLMINHFSSRISRPIIGIGHSMGGCQIAQLSLLHPRLFTSLVLIDPIISGSIRKGNWMPAIASVKRRDIWPSRAAAATSFGKSPFYRAWDPRVLDRWIEHGLRDLPTLLHPQSEHPEAVTLRTTKHNEVHSFLRPAVDYNAPDANGKPTRVTHPDLTPNFSPDLPFYRPEPGLVFDKLPHVRPPVLYILGAKSDVSMADERKAKMERTGSGWGGSGGAKEGKVREVLLDCGHLVPMEKVVETADEAGKWIVEGRGRWAEEERRVKEMVGKVPRADRAKMSARFVEVMNGGWIKPKI